MSENRRMLSRITANYIGLFISLVIGVILTRELIRVLGSNGFGLVALFGSTVGIGVMLKDIVQQTIIRELGLAYHDQSREFKFILANAFGVAGIVALFTGFIFIILWYAIPSLAIPDTFISASRWFVVSIGIQSIAVICLIPLINTIIVTERMLFANSLVVFERMIMLLSIWFTSAMDYLDIQESVVVYGFVSAAGIIFVNIVAALIILKIDPKVCISPALMSRSGTKDLLKHSMTQGVAATAVNLHVRIDAFIVNAFAGLTGNFAYGLGLQFSSYIRRVANGMTTGLDAVSTRFSSGLAGQDLRWLVRRSTQTHAAVILPVATLVIFYTPQLIQLWVGDLIDQENPETKRLVILITQVFALGMCARALSDAWIKILYGAGHITKYLHVVVIAVVLNPLLAVVLCWMVDTKWTALGPPLAYSIVFIVCHCLWIGFITHRTLGATYSDLIKPLIGPTIGSALGLVACLCVSMLLSDGLMQDFILGASAFTAVYLTYYICFTLNSTHRRILKRALLKHRYQ